MQCTSQHCGFNIMKYQNDTLLKCLRGESDYDHIPVWIMRQAGRYLPEFRALRAEHDFFRVCQTPELAAEITIQPIRRYPKLDAAIIFSDILVVPQAMGMEVQMVPGKGPVLPQPVVSPADISNISLHPDVSIVLKSAYDSIRKTVELLDGSVPLLGFAGAPWTLFSYMVEGGSSSTHSKAKAWLYRHPADAQKLLDAIAEVVADHLIHQVQAGCAALQVFDSWASSVAPDLYRSMIAPGLERIATKVKSVCPNTPMILFARGAHLSLSEVRKLCPSYEAYALDWSVEVSSNVRSELPQPIALQGNLDPLALMIEDRDKLKDMVRERVRSFGPRGYIANLGHGLSPEHTPEQVGQYIDIVREVSEELFE